MYGYQIDNPKDGITSDNALIDLMVYHLFHNKNGQKLCYEATKRVVDLPPGNNECAVSMCSNADRPLCVICMNGHCMHDLCWMEYLLNGDKETEHSCPICRSNIMTREIICKYMIIRELISTQCANTLCRE